MSSRGVFLFVAAGVLAAWIFVIPAPAFSQPVFVVEVVDSVGDVGLRTSIAIDSGDLPHIGYIDNTNADLKYARRLVTGWVTELAHTAGYRDSDTGLILDSADRPAMVCGGGPAYFDDTNGDLKYARRQGLPGAWEITRVDTDGVVGQYASIALDSANRPHIAYQDLTNSNLKYAVLDAYVPARKASWGELKELLRNR